MFAEENIVKLLDDMAASRVLRDSSTRGSVEESNFPDKAVPLQRWEQIFTAKKRKGPMSSITLEQFTKNSVLRAGLEVRCPHCSQRNWFDVRSLDYDLICNRFLKQFAFPQ